MARIAAGLSAEPQSITQLVRTHAISRSAATVLLRELQAEGVAVRADRRERPGGRPTSFWTRAQDRRA